MDAILAQLGMGEAEPTAAKSHSTQAGSAAEDVPALPEAESHQEPPLAAGKGDSEIHKDMQPLSTDVDDLRLTSALQDRKGKKKKGKQVCKVVQLIALLVCSWCQPLAGLVNSSCLIR